MTRMPSRESIALAISTSRESFALSGRIHSSRSLTRGAISFWRTARQCSGGRPLIDCPHAKPASILVMAASAIGETTIGCLLGAFDAMSAVLRRNQKANGRCEPVHTHRKRVSALSSIYKVTRGGKHDPRQITGWAIDRCHLAARYKLERSPGCTKPADHCRRG